MGSSSAYSRSVSLPTAKPVFSTVFLLRLLLIVSQECLVHSFVVLVPSRTPPLLFPNRQHHSRTIPGVKVALPPGTRRCSRSCSALSAKKSTASSTKKKQGKKKTAVVVRGGLRGFGTTATSNNKKSNITLDTSPETRAFYQEFLSSSSASVSSSSGDASDNLKRTALGFTTLHDDNNDKNPLRLRGVIATRDIAKGSPIIDLPYECAINLGPEGVDPTVPALTFLQGYCATLLLEHQGSDLPNAAATLRNQRYYYYRMLPPYQGVDCRTCTDFFTDAALEALQSPLMVEETQRRRQRTAEQWTTTFATTPPFPWIDGTPVTVDHLQWAVWLITSRVLTVQGDGGATSSTSSSSSKLLIPYLDMCNHDRQSPHILTGRAIPGGRLRILAGANVAAGTPIQICYSGGRTGNDRFLQDYGFLDPDERAYEIVAETVRGTPLRQSSSRSSSRPRMSEADRQRSLDALRATTMEEDEAALLKDQDMDVQIRTAIQYRLGVKRALSKYMEVP